MALGAFVAGLLLAETEYRREIEVTIEPFKGLLLGLYFVSVGAGIDPALIFARPGLILGIAAALVAVKGLILFGLARAFRLTWRASARHGAHARAGRRVRLRDDRRGARRRPDRPGAVDDAGDGDRRLDARHSRAREGRRVDRSAHEVEARRDAGGSAPGKRRAAGDHCRLWPGRRADRRHAR